MPTAPPRRPRKRFGQHFLTQPAIARRIVELAAVGPDDSVLEIGPGRGALTTLLAETAGALWLIEVDRDLAAQMRERFADRPSIRVEEGDVLRLDLSTILPAATPIVAVANLPYNISTPVLMKLLDDPARFSRLVLMLQREVAERLCAEPNTKAYGALSVMVQIVADVHIALRVSPGAFTPRPKVDSAVVVIQPRRPIPLAPAALRAVRRVVRTAFTLRRKQLVNALASLHPQPQDILARLGIDPRRRPETLTINEFVRLSEALGEPPSG